MIATLTVFHLPNKNIRWALAQMGSYKPKLNKVPGLKFYKLLGSGSGTGFSPWPNFTCYGLFMTWENEVDSTQFFQNSPFFQEYTFHCTSTFTVWLKPYQSHGEWNGNSLFELLAPKPEITSPIAVLTRANIRWRSLWNFWKQVPKTTEVLSQASGNLFSIGLGEKPMFEQATFSIWENEEKMRAYAYKMANHQEAIKKTRAQKWYSEELFTRFIPYKTEGNILGINPLDRLL